MTGHAVTLLTRPDCHLCEEFVEALRSDALWPTLALTEQDVDSRSSWSRRWGLKIPVLLDARGELICWGQYDPAALREAFRVI